MMVDGLQPRDTEVMVGGEGAVFPPQRVIIARLLGGHGLRRAMRRDPGELVLSTLGVGTQVLVVGGLHGALAGGVEPATAARLLLCLVERQGTLLQPLLQRFEGTVQLLERGLRPALPAGVECIEIGPLAVHRCAPFLELLARDQSPQSPAGNESDHAALLRWKTSFPGSHPRSEKP